MLHNSAPIATPGHKIDIHAKRAQCAGCQNVSAMRRCPSRPVNSFKLFIWSWYHAGCWEAWFAMPPDAAKRRPADSIHSMKLSELLEKLAIFAAGDFISC